MKPTPNENKTRHGAAFGDTFAWLFAAFQVIGPILLVLVTAIALAYAGIHLLFLRR
jgi:hypothetical protein